MLNLFIEEAWLPYIELVCTYTPPPVSSNKILTTVYNAFVLPYTIYCHFCSKSLTDNLQCVQNYAMRTISNNYLELVTNIAVHGLLLVKSL